MCLSRKKKKNYKNLKWINSDLDINKFNFEKIRKFNPYALIHLSWEKIPDFSKKVCEKNEKDNIIFFNKIQKINSLKKIIITGTCLEYKNKKGEKNEKDKVDLKNYFSKSKIKIYNFVNQKFKKKVSIAWFRLFYVYGPHQRRGSLLPSLIKSIDKNRQIEIKTPNHKNDFIFVSDVAKIIRRSLFLDFSSGIYNLGSGKPEKILNLIKILEKLKKKSFNIKYKTNSEKKIFYADTSKLKKTFKIKKFKSLKNGLKEIINMRT